MGSIWIFLYVHAAFYCICYKCIDAILQCEEMVYSLPSTEEELNNAAMRFKECSTNGAVNSCVGCVDGHLLPIQTPAKDETENVKAYFSGHYKTHGINVQAACDSRCCFLYIALVAPGRFSNCGSTKNQSLLTD